VSGPCKKCPDNFPEEGGCAWNTNPSKCKIAQAFTIAQRAREEYSNLINAKLTTGDFSKNCKDEGAKEVLEEILGPIESLRLAAHPQEEKTP